LRTLLHPPPSIQCNPQSREYYRVLIEPPLYITIHNTPMLEPGRKRHPLSILVLCSVDETL
jgi:hypothetical protein